MADRCRHMPGYGLALATQHAGKDFGAIRAATDTYEDNARPKYSRWVFYAVCALVLIALIAAAFQLRFP